ALGDLRPGALSMQYNICGNPSCRCKADPPLKHGPYPQVSFTWHGKSTTQFVREPDVQEVQTQLANYHQLRHLVDEWIGLALELSRLRLQQHREAASGRKKALKPQKTNKNPSDAARRSPDDALKLRHICDLRVSLRKLASLEIDPERPNFRKFRVGNKGLRTAKIAE